MSNSGRSVRGDRPGLPQSRERRAWQQAALAVGLWSTVAVAFKWTLHLISPLEIVALAGIFSWMVLAAAVWYLNLGTELARLGARQWLRAALLGLLNPVAYYAALLAAYDQLPAQIAQVVNYSWAIALALLAVPLLGQPLSVSKLAALGLGYGGVLIVGLGAYGMGDTPPSLAGLGLALLSSFIWALYWLLSARSRISQTALLFASFTTALPWLAALWAFASGLQLPPWQGLLGSLYIGVFDMGLTFILWGGALRMTRHAGALAQLIFLAPFLSLLWISWLLDERIFITTPLGLGFIVLGMVLHDRAVRRTMSTPDTKSAGG